MRLKPINTKEQEKYRHEYPSYLSPRVRMWTTRPGDRLSKDGIEYVVLQVLTPLVKGALPRIVIQEVKDDNDCV